MQANSVEASTAGTLELPRADLPAFINALPVGVLIVDGDGRIKLANTQLLTMFQYEHDALLGQAVEMLVPDALRAGHREMRTAFSHAPQQRPMGGGGQLHACRSNGTLFPVEIGLAPLESNHGPMFMATVVDMSQRDQLQGELSALIDSTPMGIAVIDAAGLITRMNQRGAGMFGYEVEELISQPLDLLIPERHRPAHEGHRVDYFANPTPRFMGKGRDLTGLHRDGTEFPVEVGLNLFGDSATPSVVATINDITDRKYAEQALRQANADLDEFTYVASHDLKSPVRGIGSLLEWIEEDLGDDVPADVRHNLDRARIRVERMQQLIDDLLVYSRAGRVRDAFEDTDLDRLIDEVLETVSPPDGFSVRRELEVSRLPTAKTPLATVLRNLVSNAIKHHDRDRGEVLLRVRRHGAYLVIEVCDDGPGVPASAHERICKLFQTLSGSGDQPRSGIGLAVSKRLVQVHGGTLEIESNDNERGSIFRFTWPLVQRKDFHDQTD